MKALENLFQAIRNGEIEKVRKTNKKLFVLFLDGKSALHIACEFGHLEIAKYLIEEIGIDASQPTQDLDYPLTFALASQHVGVMTNANYVKAALRGGNWSIIYDLLTQYPHLHAFLKESRYLTDVNTKLHDKRHYLYFLQAQYEFTHALEQWWSGVQSTHNDELEQRWLEQLELMAITLKEGMANPQSLPDHQKQVCHAYPALQLKILANLCGLKEDTNLAEQYHNIQAHFDSIRSTPGKPDIETYFAMCLIHLMAKNIPAAQALLHEALIHYPSKGLLFYLEFYLHVRTNEYEQSQQWIMRTYEEQILPPIKTFYCTISCFPWLISDLLQHPTWDPVVKTEYIQFLGSYPSPREQSLLHLACKLQDKRLARILLDFNVGYIEECYQDSPLEYAATIGHTEMVKLICDYDRYSSAQHERTLQNTLTQRPEQQPEMLRCLLDTAINHPHSIQQTFATQLAMSQVAQLQAKSSQQTLEPNDILIQQTMASLETARAYENDSPNEMILIATQNALLRQHPMPLINSSNPRAARPAFTLPMEAIANFFSCFDKKEMVANLSVVLKTLLELTPSLVSAITKHLESSKPRDMHFVVDLLSEILNTCQRFAIDKHWMSDNQNIYSFLKTFITTFATYYQDDLKAGIHKVLPILLKLIEEFAVKQGWIKKDAAFFKALLTLLEKWTSNTEETPKEPFCEAGFWTKYGKHIPQKAHYPLRIATAFITIQDEMKQAQIASYSGNKEVWKEHFVTALKLLLARLHPVNETPIDYPWDDVLQEANVYPHHFFEYRLSIYIPLFRAAVCVGTKQDIPAVTQAALLLLNMVEALEVALENHSALPEKLLEALEAGLNTVDPANPILFWSLWTLMFGFLGIEAWQLTSHRRENLIHMVTICRQIETRVDKMTAEQDVPKDLLKGSLQILQWIYIAKNRLSLKWPEMENFDMTEAFHLVAQVIQGGVCLGIAREEPLWIVLGEAARALMSTFGGQQQANMTLDTLAPQLGIALNAAVKEIEQDVEFLSHDKKEALLQSEIYLALHYGRTLANHGQTMAKSAQQLIQLWRHVDTIKKFAIKAGINSNSIHAAFTQLLEGKTASFKTVLQGFQDLVSQKDIGKELFNKAKAIFDTLPGMSSGNVSLPTFSVGPAELLSILNLAATLVNIGVTVYYGKKILRKIQGLENIVVEGQQKVLSVTLSNQLKLNHLATHAIETHGQVIQIQTRLILMEQTLLDRMAQIETQLMTQISELRTLSIRTTLIKHHGKFQEQLKTMEFRLNRNYFAKTKTIFSQLEVIYRLLNLGNNESSINHPFLNGQYLYDALEDKQQFFNCLLYNDLYWSIQPAGIVAYAQHVAPSFAVSPQGLLPNYDATLYILSWLSAWIKICPEVANILNADSNKKQREMIINTLPCLLTSLEDFHQQLRNKELIINLFQQWLRPNILLSERLSAFLALKVISFYAGLPIIGTTAKDILQWTGQYEINSTEHQQACAYVEALRDVWIARFANNNLPPLHHPYLEELRFLVQDIMTRCAPDYITDNLRILPDNEIFTYRSEIMLQLKDIPSIQLASLRVDSFSSLPVSDMHQAPPPIAQTSIDQTSTILTATSTSELMSPVTSSSMVKTATRTTKKGFFLTLKDRLTSLSLENLHHDADEKGRTGYHLLAAMGYVDKVTSLPELLLDGTTADKKARTPLHTAAKYRQEEFVTHLMSKNMRLHTLADSEGKTPAQLLWERQQTGTTLSLTSSSYHLLLELTASTQLSVPTMPAHDFWSPALLQMEYLTRDLAYLPEFLPGCKLTLGDSPTTYKVTCLFSQNNWRIFCLVDEETTTPLQIVCHIASATVNFNRALLEKTITQCHSQAARLKQVAYQLQQNYPDREIHIAGSGIGGLLAQYLMGYYLLLDRAILPSSALTTFHAPGVSHAFIKEFINHRSHDSIAAKMCRKLIVNYVYHPEALIHQLGGINLFLQDTFDDVTLTAIQIQDQPSTSPSSSLMTTHQIRWRQQQAYELRIWDCLTSKKTIRGNTTEATTQLIQQQTNPPPSLRSHPQSSFLPSSEQRQIEYQTGLEPYHTSIRNLMDNGKLCNPAWELFLPFIYGEALGHYLAYCHLEDYDIVTLFNLQGEQNKHTCFRLHHANGLYIYALCPNYGQNNYEMKILVQGTDPTDLPTINRDLDRGSPGHAEFKRKAYVIIEQLGQLLTENQHIQSIRVCGHSLGGALAQNMLTAIMGAKMHFYLSEHKLAARQELLSSLSGKVCTHTRPFILRKYPAKYFSPFENLQGLTLTAFNAPGARKSTVALCLGLKQLIKQFQPNFDFAVYYQVVKKDGVHCGGQAYVLVGDPLVSDVEGGVMYLTESEYTDAHIRFWYQHIQADQAIPTHQFITAKEWTRESVFPKAFQEPGFLEPAKKAMQTMVTQFIYCQ